MSLAGGAIAQLFHHDGGLAGLLLPTAATAAAGALPQRLDVLKLVRIGQVLQRRGLIAIAKLPAGAGGGGGGGREWAQG